MDSEPWYAHIPPRKKDPKKPKASKIGGKGRPRFTKAGIVHTPTKTKKLEQQYANACNAAKGDRETSHADWVVLGIVIVDQVPKSWRRTKSGNAYTKRAIRAAWQQEPTLARPDVDQVIKAALDGAAKGGWFRGDAKVLPCPWRCWTLTDEKAGVHIMCWPAPTPAATYGIAYRGDAGPFASWLRRLAAPPPGTPKLP